jgi:hypothetical protein
VSRDFFGGKNKLHNQYWKNFLWRREMDYTLADIVLENQRKLNVIECFLYVMRINYLEQIFLI